MKHVISTCHWRKRVGAHLKVGKLAMGLTTTVVAYEALPPHYRPRPFPMNFRVTLCTITGFSSCRMDGLLVGQQLQDITTLPRKARSKVWHLIQTLG